MSEVMCAAPLIRGTEFFLNDAGVRLFGTCGPRALASVASSSLGYDISALGVYDSMLQHGWCDSSGASTIGGLHSQALQMHCTIAAFQPYGEPWTSWQAWLTAQVSAGNPCVIELANGQALKDAVSGLGENAVNLQYHYIGILGMNSPQYLPGFWAADGDNFAGGNNNSTGFNAADVLQYYTDSVLAAARPCAAIALKGRAVTMAWTTETNGDGKDSAGHVCTPGFMAAMKDNGDLDVDGLASSVSLPNDTEFLALSNGTLYVADPPSAAFHCWTGEGLSQEWLKLYSLYEVAKSTPAPAPVSEADQLAVQALAAIKAALAA